MSVPDARAAIEPPVGVVTRSALSTSLFVQLVGGNVVVTSTMMRMVMVTTMVTRLFQQSGTLEDDIAINVANRRPLWVIPRAALWSWWG